MHSELPLLRRFLLIDGLLPLKAASTRHYEMYRSRSLFGVKALLKALLPPVQLLLVSMAAPPPRRWARSQLRDLLARAHSLRSARQAAAATAATAAAAAAVPPKRARQLTLSQAIRERSRASRRAREAQKRAEE